MCARFDAEAPRSANSTHNQEEPKRSFGRASLQTKANTNYQHMLRHARVLRATARVRSAVGSMGEGKYPKAVRIVEVGARDGLQNEKKPISTAQKVELIERLVQSGLKTIEAGSFVSPKWVPQMADGEQVVRQVLAKHGDDASLSFPVLTPNMRGYEAAVAAGATTVAIFGSASESFSQKNINCSIDESFERFAAVARQAARDNVRVRGYVSCVLGCPFEGPIAHESVTRVSQRMLELGCYEVSLGDTIGTGTAGTTNELLTELLKHVPVERLAAHFHDTYGQALANLLVALQHGIAVIDSSVAGLGGCPYAPAAKGNVATEDVVYMLRGMGIETGIDFERLIDTAGWVSADVLDRPPASRVALALLSNKYATCFA